MLLDRQAEIKARLKASQEMLERQLTARHDGLPSDEVPSQVVDHNWLTRLGPTV